MVLTRARIAKEVCEALEWPYEVGNSKGHKLVNLVLRIIVDTLRAGEKVEIIGLGTFKLRTKKASRSSAMFFYGRRKRSAHMVIDVPAKTYVHFTPSKPLLRDLNNGNHQQ